MHVHVLTIYRKCYMIPFKANVPKQRKNRNAAKAISTKHRPWIGEND